MKCASCGTESSGNFCPSCGASMRARHCPECGVGLVPGARFCTACGADTGAAASAGGAGGAAGGTRGARRRRAAAGAGRSEVDGEDRSNLPWYIAGAVLLVLIFVLVTPMIMGEDNSVPPRGTAPLTAPGGLSPLTGTPREQADRLFNRVMAAREQGNSAEALQFAPMGVQAYQMAEPLDDDGLYHLATLQNTMGDYPGALQTTERILARNPNHLLGLAAAAEAAEGLGDADAALDYHRRLVDAYDTEIGSGLPEYMDHAAILPEYRRAALRATGG